MSNQDVTSWNERGEMQCLGEMLIKLRDSRDLEGILELANVGCHTEKEMLRCLHKHFVKKP